MLACPEEVTSCILMWWGRLGVGTKGKGFLPRGEDVGGVLAVSITAGLCRKIAL